VRISLHRCAVVVLFALIPALCRADVTVRYQIEVKLNPNLPPQMAQGVQKGLANSPTVSSLLFRDGKQYSVSGEQEGITDLRRKEVTFIDRQGKRYATVPFDQLGDVLRQAVNKTAPAAPTFSSHFEARPSNRTESIHGILGEEHEWVLTADLGATASTGVLLRMDMHVWTAQGSEIARVPALRELSEYDLPPDSPANPLSSLQSGLAQLPGVGEGFGGMLKELQSSPTHVILRIEIDLSMPMVVALMKQGVAGSSVSLDPDATLMSMTFELSDLSTDPLPDTLFQVPPGYQAASLSDILKDQIQRKQAAMASSSSTAGGVAGGIPGGLAGGSQGGVVGGILGAIPAAPPPPPPPHVQQSGAQNPQRIRVGGAIQAANLIQKVTPEYPPLAKQARITGTVRFSAIIGKDGTIQDLQLVSGHPLLVPAAQAAVKQWVYKPTLMNGEPVEVITQIDVNFTLSQ